MKTLSRSVGLVAAALLASGASAAGTRIYVPLGESSQIQVVDTSSNRVVATFSGVANAHGLAITPDGRYLVAGSYSEEMPGAPPEPDNVSQDEHAKHHAGAAAPAQSQPQPAGISQVFIVDATGGSVIGRVPVRGAVHHVAISPAGRVAVTTHPGTGRISVIDLDRREVVATVPTAAAPNYAAFSSDGRKVYVSNAGDDSVSEVDTASWTVIRRIGAGRGPEHVVLSPDGGTLYASAVGDGAVSAISLAEGRVARTFAVGPSPHGLDLSADGKTLFATSMGSDEVVSVDLSSGSTRRVPLGPAPYHLSAVRGAGTLYVSSRAQNRIWVLDQAGLALRGEVDINGIGHQMAIAAR